ncbi:hypothetical protein LCL97_05305 [Seohaeicola saemankumensis]|nr:hypothetical protein [Seohaeicola saemankumensis]MCA0870228.1 hypothetical protein [Seohaeicola saemankumensis]
MTEPMEVAEIVTFRLIEGRSEADFTAAARAVETRFREGGQMRARCLSRAPDGTWTDHVVWRSQAAAETAAREVTTAPDCAPFMAMIDPGSVAMSQGRITRRMD